MPDLKERLERAGPQQLPPLDVEDLWRRGRSQQRTRTGALVVLVLLGVTAAGAGIADLVGVGSGQAPFVGEAPVTDADATAEQQLDAALGTDWRSHRIVYQSASDRLHAMRLDGSDDQVLTDPSVDAPTGFDLAPRLSPDGSRLAFSRGGSGSVNVMVASADGSAARPVTDVPAGWVANYPAWTTDGEQLIYTYSDSQPPHELRIVRSDGSDDRLLTMGTNADVHPDGTTVLFENDGSVWSAPLDGAEEPVVLVEQARSAAWSPDGTRISYVDAEDRVHVVGTDGSGDRVVTRDGEGPLLYGTPSWWSPDGRWVMVTSGREVLLAEVDGDRRVALFAGARWDMHWWWPR